VRDWRWELRHAITTVTELSRWLELDAEERAGAERAAERGLPLRITPYYLSLADRHDPHCPIRRQVVPRVSEAEIGPGEEIDPLAERAHEIAPRLVQRYPDRALLMVTGDCSVHCRFCTRSRLVGARLGAASLDALAPAFAELERRPEIREVIVSGGDPLVLGTARLVAIVAALRRIRHLEVIRLGTRTLATLPARITASLLAALAPYHPLWVMSHFNHPRELTAEAGEACRRLVDGGFPVMNQTVLLRGVNDRADVLVALLRGLVRWRVRPYYLMQMDPVAGAGHLRTPLSCGEQLMAELQGRLSGIALPKLVVDTPGGAGKVPLGASYVLGRETGRTRLRTPAGVEVDYLDPPSRS
jgi:lysine 2,3-aminomutase